MLEKNSGMFGIICSFTQILGGEYLSWTSRSRGFSRFLMYTRSIHLDLVVIQTLSAHTRQFLKDLSTGETTQITSGETLAANPDIHDDIVVWMDYRACDNPNNKNDHQNIEIWGYDLSTETEFQITDLPGWPKGFPRIWKDKVYVHMFRELAKGDAIYEFDLPEH
jgi:beta propeller repeat protein